MKKSYPKISPKRVSLLERMVYVAGMTDGKHYISKIAEKSNISSAYCGKLIKIIKSISLK
jgi:hypothetical protein